MLWAVTALVCVPPLGFDSVFPVCAVGILLLSSCWEEGWCVASLATV